MRSGFERHFCGSKNGHSGEFEREVARQALLYAAVSEAFHYSCNKFAYARQLFNYEQRDARRFFLFLFFRL